MQTIIFFNSISFWGGGEKLHLEYAEKFVEKGYRVVLFISRNGELDKRCPDKKFIIEYISIGKLSFLNPVKIASIAYRIANYGASAIIFSASQDMKFACIAGRKAGVKSLVYLRGLAVPVKNNFVNRQLFYNYITHFAMNSLETERCTIGSFDRQKIQGLIQVIYHGIDLKEFNPENFQVSNFRAGYDGVIIGNAGRLTPQKAQIDLIIAASLLKKKNLNFKILIAGSGDLHDELQKAIRHYHVEDCVTLAGFIRDIPRFLSNIDVFALTSRWEGFGFVLVESMALGKPVVAYNLSSNPEIVSHNQNGFLISPGNIREFAEGLEKLIVNQQMRLEMGKQGRTAAENRFEITERVNEFETFIHTPVELKKPVVKKVTKQKTSDKGQRTNYQR
ncbi:MAG: glycosyltransferase [Bacteroidetes bacterium]|nr:glycosyltransferase [Bacteroidota bacterium]